MKPAPVQRRLLQNAKKLRLFGKVVKKVRVNESRAFRFSESHRYLSIYRNRSLALLYTVTYYHYNAHLYSESFPRIQAKYRRDERAQDYIFSDDFWQLTMFIPDMKSVFYSTIHVNDGQCTIDVHSP